MKKRFLSVILCMSLLIVGCSGSKNMSFNEYSKKTSLKLNEESIYKNGRFIYSTGSLTEDKKGFIHNVSDIYLSLGEDDETGELLSVYLSSGYIDTYDTYDTFKKELELLVSYMESSYDKEIVNSALDIVKEFKEFCEMTIYFEQEENIENLTDKEIQIAEYKLEKYDNKFNNSREILFKHYDEKMDTSITVYCNYGILSIEAISRCSDFIN